MTFIGDICKLNALTFRKEMEPNMTIIELLERNAREWPNDTALVEINPDQP